ncbi:pancreatic lipase-related protein 2 [Fopius arisanus]|uniref:phospholipase A1 n=2 Tax=Fopius arisanus TaxID=64838 RepID=A0A9R1TQT5_9HYME|nr:PREDICTED: pancreatic lipase-related protein 2-like [Fopius arisanus]
MMTLSLLLVALASVDAVAAATTKFERIFLRVFLRENSYRDAPVASVSDLIPHFDINKKTVFYIHGFSESVNSSSVMTIVSAYLKRDDHNVVAIDWSELAAGNYMEVISHVEEVGNSISRGINELVKGGISPLRIHVVGHSMGAHVAGNVGRKIGFLLPRITGLDPAGPFFNFFNERLTRSDAKLVDIIHTDAGFYGIARPSGTVEFWPNGGTRLQPGCPSNSRVYTKEDFCSHHRSYVYYAESLLNENAFLSTECSSESGTFERNGNGKSIPMGYATPPDTIGSYCLVTGTKEPFGLAAKGELQAPDPTSQLLPIAS